MLVQYVKSIGQEQRSWLEYEKARAAEEDPDGPKRRRRGRIFQDAVLCKSLGGVEVPIITITNFDDANGKYPISTN